MKRKFGRAFQPIPFASKRRRLTGFRRGFFGTRTKLFTGRFVRQNGPPELKFFNSDIDDASVAAGATIIGSINLIAQGVGESQRIGRKCVVRQVHGRWNLRLPNQTNVGAAESIRILIVLDKQANGANAATTDIVETASYLSFNNLANKGRFRTLMDRTYILKPTSGAGDGTTNDSGEDMIQDSLYKPVNIPIEFSGTSGVIGEITSNNILVVTFAKAGAGVVMDGRFRVRFSDS